MVLKQFVSLRVLSDRQALYVVAPESFQSLCYNFRFHVNILTQDGGTYFDSRVSVQVVVHGD